MNDMEKLTALQAAVDAQEKRFHSAMVRTGVIMGILVLFVAFYTAYIFEAIAETATPETVAELIDAQARGYIAAYSKELRTQMPKMADSAADRTVGAVEDAIPVIGENIRVMLQDQTDFWLSKLEKEQVPEIRSFLDSTIADVLKQKSDVKDLGKTLAASLGEQLDAKLSLLLNERFYEALDKFQQELSTLRNIPTAKLTRRQFSERKFLLCWLRIAELDATDSGSGTMPSVVGAINNMVYTIQDKLSVKK